MSLAKPDEPITRGELVITYLLRGGVVTSIVVIVVGLVIMFAHHPSYRDSHEDLRRLLQPDAVFPHTLSQVAAGLREGRGQAVVCVGLLLLIATPILRVAVSILVFAGQRDWVFVVITSFVLAVLVLSFFLGKVE
jgi:uncharacterized membrane protein